MRRIGLICIAIFLIVSCNIEKQKNLAVVSGKVNTEFGKIVFKYFKENTADMKASSYIAHVDSLGCFSIEIPVQTITKGVMETANSRYDVVLSPKDKLEIIITEDSVIYSGIGAQKNTFINNLGENSNSNFLMRSWYTEEHNLYEMYQMLEDFVFVREKELTNYKENNSFDTDFISYFEIETNLNYLSLLKRIPVAYSRQNKLPIDSIQVPEKYEKEITINSILNDDYLVSIEYIRLLEGIVRNKIDEITTVDTSITREEARLSVIMDSLTGKTREHYLAQDIYNDLTIWDYYDSLTIDTFKSISLDENCKIIINKEIEKFDIKNAMLGMPLNKDLLTTVIFDTANVKMTIGDVVNKLKGEVIYLDTWSTNCGPCRMAMPLSKMLKEKLTDKPIEFVYITIDKDSENLWDEVFEVSQTRKNHYRFEKEFNSKLHNMFSIRAVPTYLLIDKQGNLVSYNAERPFNMSWQVNLKLEEKLIELADK